MIDIRREELTSETAGVLIAALNAELRKGYPEDGVNYFRLDADEVRRGHGALETGTRQPEAIALYKGAGFSETGPFGEYRPSPLNTFMEKSL